MNNRDGNVPQCVLQAMCPQDTIWITFYMKYARLWHILVPQSSSALVPWFHPFLTLTLCYYFFSSVFLLLVGQHVIWSRLDNIYRSCIRGLESPDLGMGRVATCEKHSYERSNFNFKVSRTVFLKYWPCCISGLWPTKMDTNENGRRPFSVVLYCISSAILITASIPAFLPKVARILAVLLVGYIHYQIIFRQQVTLQSTSHWDRHSWPNILSA